MNPLLPALRELARIYDRQVNRAGLWLARRKLAKAETHLGLLGWQQADFEGEAQRHIDQLKNFELEQARLTNESAALGLAIREGQEKRAAGRQSYEAARAAAEAEWQQASEPIETAERHLAARRKIDVDFTGLMANLQRELAEVEELHAELLKAESLTPEMRAEMSRLRARSVAIPNAQADLKHRQVQAMNDIHALEQTLARARPLLAAATEKLHALDVQFERSDGTLERMIAQRMTQKEGVEKQIENLEKAKENPYRQIGQILADNDIAPMNQPEALEAVQRRRAVIAGLVRSISASHELSHQEDALALRKSWALLAVVGGVVSVTLFFLAN